MILEPLVLVWLVVLGAWSALDGSSFGQVLVSRPLVSGVLTGFLLGEPVTGLLVGAILEAVHLVDFPVGAVRLPEPGPGAVPAVAAAGLLGGAGGLAVGVGLGALMARLAGYTVIRQRHLNERIIAPLLDGRASPRDVAVRHWLCVLTDGVRGAVLTAAGLAVAISIPPPVVAWWPLETRATVLLLFLPAALAGGALLRRWTRASPGRVALAVGLASGVLVGLFVGG